MKSRKQLLKQTNKQTTKEAATKTSNKLLPEYVDDGGGQASQKAKLACLLYNTYIYI